MRLEDFKPDDVFDYEYKGKLWGNDDVCVGLILNEEAEDKEALFKSCFNVIKEKIEWINNNRNKIEKALLDDGMVELAEDWASSSEEAEDEEQECYIMDDGTKVFIPITEEDFCNSLHLDGFTIYCDSEKDISVDVFLFCKPDYFAYHSIELFVNEDNTIDVNGLAG